VAAADDSCVGGDDGAAVAAAAADDSCVGGDDGAAVAAAAADDSCVGGDDGAAVAAAAADDSCVGGEDGAAAVVVSAGVRGKIAIVYVSAPLERGYLLQCRTKWESDTSASAICQAPDPAPRCVPP